MARILLWPDLYKEHGHWLPTVSLAGTLQNAGHTVRFMGIADAQSIVAPYLSASDPAFDVIFYDLYPPGHSIENDLEPEDQRWKPHHLLPLTRGALSYIFNAAEPPELLIAGYFTSLETLLLHYLYDVPIAITTTYLRHPYDTPAQHALTKLRYMSEPMQRKIMNAVLTEDERAKITTLSQFVKPLRDAQELIPCAQEFDFADADWSHDAVESNVNYVEPMIERAPLAVDAPGLPDPTALQADSSTRLIFGTSGSQVQDYEFQARAFFKDLIAMMKTPGLEDALLVLAVGERMKTQLEMEYGVDVNQSKLPGNVKLEAWVSQLDILKRAEVVFMHGGLATIKESIWEEVPIVLVPHGKDQGDNALRIKRAGVGVVTQVEDLTPLRLRKYFATATSSPWIKSRLAAMRERFVALETEKPSLTVINGVLSA